MKGGKSVQSASSVMRIFRICRVMRLIKKAKTIKVLIDTLIFIMPQLANIGILVFLMLFIYSALGMNFFGKIRPVEMLDPLVNFQSFNSGLLLLFRAMTGESWNFIMRELADSGDTDKKILINDGKIEEAWWVCINSANLEWPLYSVDEGFGPIQCGDSVSFLYF